MIELCVIQSAADGHRNFRDDTELAVVQNPQVGPRMVMGPVPLVDEIKKLRQPLNTGTTRPLAPDLKDSLPNEVEGEESVHPQTADIPLLVSEVAIVALAHETLDARRRHRANPG